jgi:hypothetical protein
MVRRVCSLDERVTDTPVLNWRGHAIICEHYYKQVVVYVNFER